MKTLSGHDGLPLHWREWGADAGTPARGTVLIVHGLGEHIGRYAGVAERFNDWGWHVAGYDQRGHGASGGPRGDIPSVDALLRDLACVIDAVRGDARLGGGPLMLLGHSLGGLVAARFVAGQVPPSDGGALPDWSRPVDALVLSSPALDPGLSGLQRAMLAVSLPTVPHLAVGNGLNPAWISRSPEVVQAYRDDPLVHDRITPTLARMLADFGAPVLAQAPRWPVPTLLMWAGADRCVAPTGSLAFAKAAAQAPVQAIEFPGLFHELFHEPERERVFDRLKTWVAARS